MSHKYRVLVSEREELTHCVKIPVLSKCFNYSTIFKYCAQRIHAFIVWRVHVRDSNYFCNITSRYNQALQSSTYKCKNLLLVIDHGFFCAYTRAHLLYNNIESRWFNCELSNHCEIQLPYMLYSRASLVRTHNTQMKSCAQNASLILNARAYDLSIFIRECGLINTVYYVYFFLRYVYKT